MSANPAPSAPNSTRRIIQVAGSLLLLLGMVLYGIFLPFFECGIVMLDCYFIPLGLYYPLMIGATAHLGVVWFAAILKKETRPGWLWRISIFHTGVVVAAAAIYMIYHMVHPGWHESGSGFSPQYELLKPWHETIGEELFFPFLLVSTLLIFFNPQVKWWLKPIMLLGLGMLILVP